MNVKQAVPFFAVSNIAQSIRFYVDGLGFTMTKQWVDGDQLRWCWLECGGAALMLQEFKQTECCSPVIGPGGVTVYFVCADALGIYHEVESRGLKVQQPFVGNGMWVTELVDPDGYRIAFESPTNETEESIHVCQSPTSPPNLENSEHVEK